MADPVFRKNTAMICFWPFAANSAGGPVWDLLSRTIGLLQRVAT